MCKLLWLYNAISKHAVRELANASAHRTLEDMQSAM